LTILQNNCQISKSEIAKELGIPKTTVYNRVARLEEKGIIKGYEAVLDPEKLGQDFQIIINVKAKYGKDYKRKVGQMLAQLPGVWAVFFVFGEQDFIVQAHAHNRNDLIQKIENMMQMEEIERTSSIIVGEVIKFDRKLDLSAI
jgi:Lrp/AsnC family transcriptional regulator, leucine-responsive regulatory protein